MNKLKHNIDKGIGRVLVFVETVIAIITGLALIAMLGIEVFHMISDPQTYFFADDAVSHYLHEILNIVIGLEFVKLLLHLTPANILEVLTMALARGIIVSHGSALDNLLTIICIVALFAARRFLIPKNELFQEMDETGHHPASGGGRRHRHGKHHNDYHNDHHNDHHHEHTETHEEQHTH